MMQLDHPNILKMHGMSQDQRFIYMYLDYVPCGTVLKIQNQFKDNRLPKHHVQFYAKQVISCLRYLHQRQLIFRDLKPENILIAQDGDIRLADFGFVRRLEQGSRTKTQCGTPEYLAPEIVLN